MIATPSAINDAHWAFNFRTPRSKNNTSSGRTAKIEVIPREWETGSRTCLYTERPPINGTIAGGLSGVVLPLGAANHAPGPRIGLRGRLAAGRAEVSCRAPRAAPGRCGALVVP